MMTVWDSYDKPFFLLHLCVTAFIEQPKKTRTDKIQTTVEKEL